LQHRAEQLCSDEPTDLAGIEPASFRAYDEGKDIWGGRSGPRFDFDFFRVHVDYGAEGPLLRDGQPKTLRVSIVSTDKIPANLSLHWYLPEGLSVSPSADGYIWKSPWGTTPLDFTFTAERLSKATNRAVLEITISGRPTVMLVPVTLLNGNLIRVNT